MSFDKHCDKIRKKWSIISSETKCVAVHTSLRIYNWMGIYFSSIGYILYEQCVHILPIYGEYLIKKG